MKTVAAAVLFIAMSGTAAFANGSPLDDAHRLFYNGQYEAAAARALEVRTDQPDNLAATELRTSALHFQIRRVLGEPVSGDRERAWKLCSACQELMTLFMAELSAGQAAARARLRKNPLDEEAMFFLGKLDLNYIWLQIETAGRKTGWNEYWEARRSLDTVLKRNPAHVRAQVARAWIDYILGTKLPRGTRWMLGGGSRKKGLSMVSQAAESHAEPFIQAEARFALWNMQVREKNIADAVVTARLLARDFPENQDLAKFLANHDSPRNLASAAAR